MVRYEPSCTAILRTERKVAGSAMAHLRPTPFPRRAPRPVRDRPEMVCEGCPDRSQHPCLPGRTCCVHSTACWTHNPLIPGLWTAPEWMICAQPPRLIVAVASRAESASICEEVPH